MAAFGKLVLPVPLTGPVANDAEIMPVLKPTRPPMAELISVGELPLLPVTALDEDEFVMVPAPSFCPTSPPAKLLKPLETAPDEMEPLMFPRLMPTRPPAILMLVGALPSPTVTTTDDDELVI